MTLTPVVEDLPTDSCQEDNEDEDEEEDELVTELSDLADDLLAYTVDNLIEISNSLVGIISSPSQEKPCICTKYVRRGTGSTVVILASLYGLLHVCLHAMPGHVFPCTLILSNMLCFVQCF